MAPLPFITIPTRDVVQQTSIKDLTARLQRDGTWVGLDIPQVIQTLGYTTPGDGGGGYYKKVDAEPSHAGKIQSNDGQWWELFPSASSDGSSILVDYRAFGTDATAINDAIDFVNGEGGGGVIIPTDVTVSDQIEAKDKVALIITSGATLGLDTDLGSVGFIEGENVPDFRILGGGKIDPDGNAQYAVKLIGQRKGVTISGLEICGHKGGIRIEANATSGVDTCVIRDLWVHDNFVHPTDPGGSSEAGHALSITCRPSQGFDLTERVILENIRLEATPGATNGTNQFTKDLVSVQGAKILWTDGLVSSGSGEVGFSATFGCQHVSLNNMYVEYADGHGIIMSGAHYRLDLESVSGDFTVNEEVEGGTSGATADVEYWINNGDGTAVMWVDGPSRLKIQTGETITGATSTETATVTRSWLANKFDCMPSVRTYGNGIDAAATGTDYAGVTAQHVFLAAFGGVHQENNPWGMNANSTDYYWYHNYAPLSATQTLNFQSVGSSTYLPQGVGPVQVPSPAAASGNSVRNFGGQVNENRQLEWVGKDQASILVNRTDDGGSEELGEAVEIYGNGSLLASFGTDAVLFPLRTTSSAYSHSTLPAASGYARKVMYSSSSRQGDPAFVRSDGTDWLDMVTNLPTRSGVWTQSTLEAEAASKFVVYVQDGVAGEDALGVSDGTNYYYLPLQWKSGTATIANGNSTQAVSFATQFPSGIGSANYSVSIIADGDETIWISSKAATGFTLNRSGTTSDRDVHWVAFPHYDP